MIRYNCVIQYSTKLTFIKKLLLSCYVRIADYKLLLTYLVVNFLLNKYDDDDDQMYRQHKIIVKIDRQNRDYYTYHLDTFHLDPL